MNVAEVLVLPADVRAAMVAHARAEAPLEACGLLGGRGNRAERFYPTRNAAHSPVRYEVEPADLLAVTMDLDASGGELWGVFHSHPQTEAYPSQTDLRLALYPEAVYLICSLADPQRPVLRGYRLEGTEVRECLLTAT